MPIYLTAIVLLLAMGVSLIVIANIFFYTILREVNGTLPPDKNISMLGVNLRYGRILDLHAQRFPESKKRRQLKLLWLAGFLFGGFAIVVDLMHYGKW
jgi:hypothetical protein